MGADMGKRNKTSKPNRPLTREDLERAGVVIGPQQAAASSSVPEYGNVAQHSPEEAALRKRARLDRARHGSAGYSTSGEGFVALLLALACAVALWAGVGVSSASARQQGALTLQQSVIDCAMQCFAIEGAYPQTLQHLEDDYGLAVDHDGYTVHYEAFASNVLPTVVVVPK